MATEQAPAEKANAHGGRLVAKTLAARGVSHLFTLSGGHLFSIYDGCREEGIELVDVRHEQAAAFAAEGWAKTTRTVGVAALTAGPGVTNGMSAIAGAAQNGSPITVLGGRAPEMRWGSGSLQEIDHVPFVEPLVKSARTVRDPGEICAITAAALDTAIAAPGGPTFVDFPLDVVFSEAAVEVPGAPQRPAQPAEGIDQVAELLSGAERPVVMTGNGLYWGHAEGELARLCEAVGIPVFLNGLGRGCLPADHELAYSRTRREALTGADVALVIGVPLDFRLGFGGSFGDRTTMVRVDVEANRLNTSRAPDHELVGDIAATVGALADGVRGDRDRTRAWIEQLRSSEEDKRAGEREELADDRAPLHPMRVYAELAEVLDRDTIVVGDGGDFVSYAGRVVDTYQPGCWLDPGPFGCLGAGPGQAMGAKLAHPDRQVCLLMGDGAFGFSGMEFDTMARLGIPVVAVIGNNGIWALEKHPMEALYGYSVAAELAPERRYDQVAEALGCDGELVREPGELRPALERAFASGRPTVVNVLTDPEVAYPRRSNLA